MNALASPLGQPKPVVSAFPPSPGYLYTPGRDAQIDSGLAMAGIDASGKSWWDVCDALRAAGDRSAADLAEAIAIPY